MKILLISATETEIQLLRKKITCDILITGVGSVATTYSLLKELNKKKYDIIIQAGIAGSYNNKIALGECVLIKKDNFADLGTETKNSFYTLFESGLCNKKTKPFKNGWLVNTNELIKSLPLKKVSAITVNKVSDSKKQKKQFELKYKAEVESMEGAALHFVCLLENIPFLQIRSISNLVGIRDKSKWKLKESITNLHTAVEAIINQLNKK